MEQAGKWTRRMGLAMLPIGVAFAILVLLRIVLYVMGWVPADPIDVISVLVNGLSAVFFIWTGRQYRRATP